MDIDVPFRIGGDGRTRAAADDAKHVRDMIELVLFTQPGERVMRPEFGAGLLQYAFGANRPELAATLQATIESALAHWLGDLIELHAVRVESDDAVLRATVTYAVRPTGDVRSDTFTRSAA
ncbi:MAG TPA: GPW/gp25 family protein [Rhizomicrobium sp.]